MEVGIVGRNVRGEEQKSNDKSNDVSRERNARTFVQTFLGGRQGGNTSGEQNANRTPVVAHRRQGLAAWRQYIQILWRSGYASRLLVDTSDAIKIGFLFGSTSWPVSRGRDV